VIAPDTAYRDSASLESQPVYQFVKRRKRCIMIRFQDAKASRGTSTQRTSRLAGKSKDFAPHRRTPRRPANSTVKPANSQLQERARRLLGCEIAFIHNPSFRRPDAAQTIAASTPALAPETARMPRMPDGTPAYFAQLYSTPLLTAEEEQHLFRNMNYLKFRANQLRAGLDPICANAAVVSEIEDRLAQALEVREKIISANLRLVVSIARRFVDDNNGFDELVSDGNLTLMNAVEKFDYARGFRFSTYATHAIQRDFYRQCRRRRTDRARYVRGIDELIVDAPDDEPDPVVGEQYRRYRKMLELIRSELDEREQFILAMRFGLDHDAGPQTLQVIGAQLGVSKERVRQLEIRAIATLQRVAQVEPLA
jgi:RNA polymerase primary sigma factor